MRANVACYGISFARTLGSAARCMAHEQLCRCKVGISSWPAARKRVGCICAMGLTDFVVNCVWTSCADEFFQQAVSAAALKHFSLLRLTHENRSARRVDAKGYRVVGSCELLSVFFFGVCILSVGSAFTFFRYDCLIPANCCLFPLVQFDSYPV